MPLSSLLLPGADLWFDPAFLGAAEAAQCQAGLAATVAWEQRSIRLIGETSPSPASRPGYGEPRGTLRLLGPGLGAPALAASPGCVAHAGGSRRAARFNSALPKPLPRRPRQHGLAATTSPSSAPLPHRFAQPGSSAPLPAAAPPGGGWGPLGLDCPMAACCSMPAYPAPWQHALPKTARPVGPRLNLTFRWVEAAEG